MTEKVGRMTDESRRSLTLSAPRVLLLAAALLLVMPAAVNAGWDDLPAEMPWAADVELHSLGPADDIGMRVLDVRDGSTPLQTGDVIKVMYKLYLLDDDGEQGVHIYSQSNPEEAFNYQLGSRSVIKGFAAAIETMKLGSRRVAVLPPDIAYGVNGARSFGVPPHATLLYYLEVVQITESAKGEL
eukprot:PLAT12845.2.p3 GENE.PLAT12845.2~~PLAT12845.2.p3  ORF type:complete len:185 (-),score=70.43 PLAT12845.2:132-686(-)